MESNPNGKHTPIASVHYMYALLGKSKFPLGKMFITPGVSATITTYDVLTSLAAHSQCNWGTVCREDWQANDDALIDGSRVLSAYLSGDGVRIWVITEADRSVTTVLLPEEY